MTAIQAAALTTGRKVQFSDGRIAKVIEQDLSFEFPRGIDRFLFRQTHMVKLEFEADQSIGYLNWSDMSTVSSV
jgi:hypothetical protein